MSPAKSASAPSLAGALKQTKPFDSQQQEAYLSILRTASELAYGLDRFLKPFGITQPQYNVLRILRGSGGSGLGRNEIRQRMVNAMPDMTRLLDRMEKTGWIARARGEGDRRQVATCITKLGKDLLERIDKPLRQFHLQQFQGITTADLKRLLTVLESVRAGLLDF